MANTVCVHIGNGWAGTCEFYVKEDLCLPKEKCDSLHLAMNLVDSVWRVHFSQYQVALCHYTLTCVCVYCDCVCDCDCDCVCVCGGGGRRLEPLGLAVR